MAHALKTRNALVQCNYGRFFKLYKVAPGKAPARRGNGGGVFEVLFLSEPQDPVACRAPGPSLSVVVVLVVLEGEVLVRGPGRRVWSAWA